MFSEDLQKLIEASLVDGVITDQERAVIRKRALLEGVDPDEVDLMLDAEVQKLRQKQQEAVAKVKKCPACGEIIPAMSVKCPTCGYEFNNVEANKSVQNLFSMINDIYSSQEDSETIKEEKVKMLITNFPIPTTKEDILEFLFLGIPNSKVNDSLFAKLGGGLLGGIICLILMVIVALIGCQFDIKRALGFVGIIVMFAWWLPLGVAGICWFLTRERHADIVKKNRLARVWKSKCEQIIMKAKFLMGDDPRLKEKITEFENQSKSSIFKLY